MKKRVLSVLLCLTMMLTVFPMIQLSVSAGEKVQYKLVIIDRYGDSIAGAEFEVKENGATIGTYGFTETDQGDFAEKAYTFEVDADSAVAIVWKPSSSARGDMREVGCRIEDANGTVLKEYKCCTEYDANDGELRWELFSGDTTIFSITPPLNIKGEGTEESPYLLSTVEDMNTWSKAVKNGYSFDGKYFRLNADIDISTMVAGGNDYLIHDLTNATFDGGNFKLIGGTQPLFWDVNNSTIKNLKLEGFNIVADDGGTNGRACLAVWAFNNSLIQNVHVNASTISIPKDLHNHGDAFIIGSFKGTMENCSVTNSTLDSPQGHGPWGHGAGILVGCSGCTDAQGDDVTITNCYSMSNTIKAPAANNAGFGLIAGVFRGTMTNCWAAGTIWSNVANGFPSGGLIGKSFGTAYGNFLLAPYTLWVGVGANPANNESNDQHGMLVGSLKAKEEAKMWNGEPRNVIGNYAVAPNTVKDENGLTHNGFNGYQHTDTMGTANERNAHGKQITVEAAQLAETYTKVGWSEDVWDFSFNTLSATGEEGTTVFFPELKSKNVEPVALPEPEEPVEWAGTGTEADPYQIADEATLMLLSERTNAGETYANTFFKMTADIAVPAEFATIPTFEGTLDGDNHTLSGATTTIIRETKGATIQNLKLSGSTLTINADGYIGHGALISVASNGLTLTNVHATGCSITVNDNYQEIAILVGHLNEGSSAPYNVTLCTVTNSTITLSNRNNIGWNHGGAGMIFGCGHKSSEGSDTIANCYVRDGQIFATGGARTGVGLIAGRNQNFDIQNCWASGSVWANETTNMDYAGGGLVGSLIGGWISNSFYFNVPTNDRTVCVLNGPGGRIAGVMEWAKINNCYAGATATFNFAAVEGGEANGEAQDKTSSLPARHGATLAEGAQTEKATYTNLGWDQEIWNLDCTDGYPELRVVDGTTYVPPVIGDADGDGEVKSEDVTYMLRALAGWEGYTLSVEISDLNGDGKANNKDATILMRHLTGWEGYETLPLAGK